MKVKIILITIVALVIIGAGSGYYLYNKPKDSMNDLTADFQLAAGELSAEFNSDENAANTKYLGKTIEVTGKVLSIEKGEVNVITLEGETMSHIRAEMDKTSEVKESLNGKTITLRGKCTGLLLDVVLNNCVIIKE